MTHLFEKSRAAVVALVVTVVGFGPVRGAMAATPSFPEADPSEQTAALAAQQEMLAVQPHVAAWGQEGHQPCLATEP